LFHSFLKMAMEASCSSRVQAEAEMEWAFSTRSELAVDDYFGFDGRPVNRPVVGGIDRRKNENATTDACRDTLQRHRLVNPTHMPDYVCSELALTPTSDNVCHECCVLPQKPDEKDRTLKLKAAEDCSEKSNEDSQVLLHSTAVVRQVESVLRQAQKASMTAEGVHQQLQGLHQRLVAVCNREKIVPAILSCGASSDDALHEVGKEGGACNWMLIDADGFGLHGAGRGGIEEMSSRFFDDKVLFGVLRLSFKVNGQHLRKPAQGFSTFRASNACSRPKAVCHVFVHWVGPAVSAVRRGLFNAKCTKAVAMAERHCTLAVQRRASSTKDVGIEDIVKDLRNLKALGAADCSGFEGGISAKEYFRFLQEEEKEVM